MTGLPRGLGRIVVTGAGGMLGRSVVGSATERGLNVVGLSHTQLDITNLCAVREAIGSRDLVINCAGIVPGRPDISDRRMEEINGGGPWALAFHAGRLVQVSTDCVFNGLEETKVYSEMARPCPADHYGKTKLAGEVYKPPHLTVRGSFIGFGERGLLNWLLEQPYGADVAGYTDWLWNGFYVHHFAEALLDVALGPLTMLVHLPGPVPMSKYGLLLMVAGRIRSDLRIVKATGGKRNMVLTSAQLPLVNGDWSDMLDRLEKDYIEGWMGQASEWLTLQS